MEGYVECLVSARPNMPAKIGKVVLWIVTAALGVMAILTGTYGLFLLALVFGVGAYFVGKFTDIEYEYLYLDREITVDRVYNRESRKRVGVYSLDRVEIFAPIHSYHLDNFGKRQGKTVDYSIGYEDKPDRRYIMYYEGGGIFLFSPSEEFVKEMKRQNPRKVYDD